MPDASVRGPGWRISLTFMAARSVRCRKRLGPGCDLASATRRRVAPPCRTSVASGVNRWPDEPAASSVASSMNLRRTGQRKPVGTGQQITTVFI